MGGWGLQNKKASKGGVWIFSGTVQFRSPAPFAGRPSSSNVMLPRDRKWSNSWVGDIESLNWSMHKGCIGQARFSLSISG